MTSIRPDSAEPSTTTDSQGPWNLANYQPGVTPSPCADLATRNQGKPDTVDNPASNTLFLADFLAGCLNPTASSIILGNSKRQVFGNSWTIYGQDAWQINKSLNINYGLRYDYAGPVHSDFPNLSIFDPSSPSGLAVAGQGVANIYPKFWGAVSPRVGFSWQVDNTGNTVLRGGYGYYYDTIYVKSILQNNGVQNISVFGPRSQSRRQRPGRKCPGYQPGDSAWRRHISHHRCCKSEPRTG